MGIESSVEAARGALIKRMGGRSFLRPTGLIESLAASTGEAALTMRQALARLAREGWIEGVGPDGTPFAQIRILGEIPAPPPNPDLERWALVLEAAQLGEKDREALLPLHQKLSAFEARDQERILAGLLRLRDRQVDETGQARYVVSARHLIGSSKLLDELPAAALRAFGIAVDRFPGHPLYVVAAGCAEPEAVVLIENPAAFEMAAATEAARRCAFIATFGFGLSKSQEEYGNQLASLVEGGLSGAITLTREGSACPSAKSLLERPNLFFWGDLDPAGVQIYLRMKKTIPGLRLSALYLPMLEALDGEGAHPYVSGTGKAGQIQMRIRAEGDALAESLLARCADRGVDQETVSPEQIERFAARALE